MGASAGTWAKMTARTHATAGRGVAAVLALFATLRVLQGVCMATAFTLTLAYPEARRLASYGCLTQMHVVRLLAPRVDGEDHTKDIDFSPAGIRARRAAGYAHARRVLGMAPWEETVDSIEGFSLHEAAAGAAVATS
jgi:hypothetical protein